MKKKDAIKIGDIYGNMLNSFKYNLKESNKNAFGDEPKLVGDGPETDGYHKALNDEKPEDEDEEEQYKKTKGEKEGEFYSSKKITSDDDDDTTIDSDEVKLDAVWNKKPKKSKYELDESRKSFIPL